MNSNKPTPAPDCSAAIEELGKFEKRTRWMFWALLPLQLLLWLAMVIPGLIGLLVVSTPLLILAAREDRRFWRRAREAGRVLPWQEVRDRLNRGEGTLALAVGPKGHNERIGYWLPQRAADLDPESRCPRFELFERDSSEGWRLILENETELDVWALKCVVPHLGDACFLRIPKKAVRAELTDAAKRGCVLMLYFDNCASISEAWVDEGVFHKDTPDDPPTRSSPPKI